MTQQNMDGTAEISGSDNQQSRIGTIPLQAEFKKIRIVVGRRVGGGKCDSVMADTRMYA